MKQNIHSTDLSNFGVHAGTIVITAERIKQQIPNLCTIVFLP